MPDEQMIWNMQERIREWQERAEKAERELAEMRTWAARAQGLLRAWADARDCDCLGGGHTCGMTYLQEVLADYPARKAYPEHCEITGHRLGRD